MVHRARDVAVCVALTLANGGEGRVRDHGRVRCKTKGRWTGRPQHVEDLLPPRQERVPVRLEDLEERLERHPPQIHVDRGLQPTRGLGLRCERDQYLRLDPSVEIVVAGRQVLRRHEQERVEDLGGLDTDRSGRNAELLNEQEVRRDEIPSDAGVAVSQTMDVQDCNDAELGDAERLLSLALR